MRIIGITGGIGSGKTTICHCFAALGVPVFYADEEAKRLYWNNEDVRVFVKSEIGQEAYFGDAPNTPYIASKVFNDPALLKRLEALIHPLVSQQFDAWKKDQKFSYVIREAAVLIESGAYLTCDEVILVKAPLELRMQWIRKRSALSDQDILARINHQLTDEERVVHANHVLVNDNSHLLLPMVLAMHQKWSGA